MKKIVTTSILLLVLLIGGATTTFSQSTETFEDETVDATSFTHIGQTFNVTGTLFDIDSWPGGAANGSSVLLDNYDHSNSSIPYNDIENIASSGSFVINSLYLYLGSTDGTASGGIIIRGKLSSNIKFTHTINSPSFYTWFKEDMSAYNTTYIDELEFEFTGNLTYIGIDDLELSDIALPVELTSFTANLLNKNVELNWQTATEVNNYGFEIERKSDNEDWQKIGFVSGHGNSNSPKEYSFTDNSAKNGKYSYRLKQIDIDGNFEYSDVIEVDVNNLPMEFSLSQNYPNPFNPTTKIIYSIPNSENVSLKVYDVLGKELKTLVDDYKEAGTYEIVFNANKLTSGLYLYKIIAGNNSETRKMILMR